MKIHLLRLGLAALLTFLGGFCASAPAPPRLEELAPIKLEPRWHWKYAGEPSLPAYNSIRDLSFSLNSKTLYATIHRRGVWIFDVSTRKCIGDFEPKLNELGSGARTAFSPDGKTAAYYAGGFRIFFGMWNAASSLGS